MKRSRQAKLLKTIILFPDFFPIAEDLLEEQDFTNPALQQIYTEARNIFLNYGRFDLELLQDNLPATNVLSQVLEVSGTYNDKNIRESCKKIREDRIKKDILVMTEETKKDLKDKQVNEVMTQMAVNLLKLSEQNKHDEKSVPQLAEQLRSDIEKYQNQSLWGFSTGFKTLDHWTKGFRGGEMWVIGGYTSFGKSYITLNMSFEAYKQKARVTYVSFEMDAKRLLWRVVCIMTGIPEFRLISGINLQPDEEIKRSKAIDELNKVNHFKIVDKIRTLDELRFKIIQHKIQYGSNVFVIDYLQNILIPQYRTEYDKLNHAALTLQQLAVRLDITILLLSQVNRSGITENQAGSMQFKGSGNIENACDIAITIFREDPNDKKSTILSLSKNRNVGLTGKMRLITDFEIGSFTDDGIYTG